MGILLESSLLEWMSLIIITTFTFIYYYFKSAYGYWKERGVTYIEPTPPFGNIRDVLLSRRSQAEVYQDLYNKFPDEPFVGVYQARKPALLLRDPEVIKLVMVKDFSVFQNRGEEINEDLDPLSAHLFNISGIRWRNLRVKLTPAFTSGKMKMMFQLMTECADQMVQYLDKYASKGEILELKEVMAKYTTDVIGSCAFGLHFNAIKDEDSEFRKKGRKIFGATTRQVIRRILRTISNDLLRLFKIKFMPDELTNFFTGVVRDTIEYRERNNVSRNDFMQLLIQLKNKGKILNDNETDEIEQQVYENNLNNGKSIKMMNEPMKDMEIVFTEKLIAAQAFIFFLAGFETSSTTLSFCLYELALNPDIQDKLRKSVKSNIKGPISYEDLQSMSYLDKVVNETLRKYPPLSLLTRETVEPYVIPGTSVKLETGLKMLIPAYALQHDPKYFPEPERFNPENFSEEAKAARPHYVFLPFGEGPRNCIGMRFGLLQTKLGLAMLILNYEFSVCEKTEIPLKLDSKQFITSSTTGSWLRIKKICA